MLTKPSLGFCFCLRTKYVRMYLGLDFSYYFSWDNHEIKAYLKLLLAASCRWVLTKYLTRYVLVKLVTSICFVTTSTYISMTTLLTNTVAHSTKPSFMPKTDNQPPKKFLSLALSWAKVVKNGKILTFKVNFLCQKISESFYIFFHWRI